MRYSQFDEEPFVPKKRLDESRNFAKMLIFSFLTLGIFYRIFFFAKLFADLSELSDRNADKKMLPYPFVYFLSLFFTRIVAFVWWLEITQRIEDELDRRHILCEFDMSTFWSWNFWGSFILVGPYIYEYKLINAMNLLCKSYNEELDASEAEYLKKR